jgi:hypothetical protein
MHAILALALLAQPEETAETKPIPISEQAQENSILSARGPRAGAGAVSFGGSMVGPISLGGTSLAALPAFDFRWLRGHTDHIQSHLHFRTIGFFLYAAETGVRFRPLDLEYLSLALQIDAHAAAAIAPGADGGAGLVGGLGGGILVSAGPAWLLWTASFRARCTFLDGQDDFIPSTEATLGLEFPLSRGLNAFFEGTLASFFAPGDDVHVPIVSHGLAF